MAGAQEISTFIVIIDAIGVVVTIAGVVLLILCALLHRCPHSAAQLFKAQSTSWANKTAGGITTSSLSAGAHRPASSPTIPTGVLAHWNTHDDSLLGESCLEAGD